MSETINKCMSCEIESSDERFLDFENGVLLCHKCAVKTYNGLSKWIAEFSDDDNRVYNHFIVELRDDTKETLVNGIEQICKYAIDKEGVEYESTVINTLSYLASEHKIMAKKKRDIRTMI